MSKFVFEMINITTDLRLAIVLGIGYNTGYKKAIMMGKETLRQIINKIRD